jgi:hypothetical protein
MPSDATNADNVVADMVWQCYAASRAVRRKKGVMTNDEVVALLDKWLQRRDPTLAPEAEHVRIAKSYHPTSNDVERVLRIFMSNELDFDDKVGATT